MCLPSRLLVEPWVNVNRTLHTLRRQTSPARDVNQNFMPASESWARCPLAASVYRRQREDIELLGVWRHVFYQFCFWPCSSVWSTFCYQVPRFTLKDIFQICQEECGRMCVVVLSQYWALAQFFIQTNRLHNDPQDANHSSLITMAFIATAVQMIFRRGEMLFISHNVTNQTLITISAQNKR